MAVAASPPSRPAVALSMATLLASLAACSAVGPDFHAPAVPAPAQWLDQHGGPPALAAPASAQAALPADRWALFGDPQLLELQARALQASPDLKTAAIHLLQSRVQESAVAAQGGVQLGAQAAVARQRQSEYGSASRLVNAIGGPNTPELIDALSAPFTLYDAGFDASWEPDLWGRILRSKEVAGAQADAQAAALRGMRLSLLAEVARAYFGLRGAQRQEQLLDDELAAARGLAGLLRALPAQGLSDASAGLQQDAQLAGLEALRPALQAQQAQALNQLTRLCGAAPGALNAELGRAPAPAAAATLPDLRLGLPAELARRRPDIAAAEADLHAATAGIGVSVADLYPRVSLGASFGLESVGNRHFGDWGARQWSLGPSLSLPLFDQGRRRAVIVLRELQQQEAAVAFQKTVLAAWHEVDDAISGYEAQTRRNAQLAQRVAAAVQDAGLARARYASGVASDLPALTAEASVVQARRDLADGRTRAETALVAVYKALGDDGRPPPSR